MNRTHWLVISDIHLGSNQCDALRLQKFLESWEYEKLIIVGDLLENDPNITDEHLLLGLYLREQKKKVVCVDGNHDPAEDGLVQRFFNIPVYKQYRWRVGGRLFCAMHGHQFDRMCFVFKEQLVDKAFLMFVSMLKRFNLAGISLAKRMQAFHENFSLHIANRAIKYATKHCLDVMICGHTHQPLHQISGSVEYFNCGSWVEKVSSYVTVDCHGRAQLHVLPVA